MEDAWPIPEYLTVHLKQKKNISTSSGRVVPATKIQKLIDEYKDMLLYNDYCFFVGIGGSLNSTGFVE